MIVFSPQSLLMLARVSCSFSGLYQACKEGASLALKKMPPMPVTRFISIANAVWLEEKVPSAA